MDEQQARTTLQARVAEGARLAVGSETDWASIKRLLESCLQAGIPAMLAECAGGG